MKSMSRRAYAFATLAFAVVIFFAVNIFADAFFLTARIDLTENGAYTLSQGTRNIIAKLPEPVTLRFYYSKTPAAQYPGLAAYAKQVRDLLAEYAALSHGKIVLEDVDPEPFTAEQDEASAAGIAPNQTDSGDIIYFGLVGTNSVDGHEVIPFFSQARQPYLEYDISALLYRLSNPRTPVIGLISGLPLEGNSMYGQPPLTIYTDLQKSYRLLDIGNNPKSIPSNVDALLIAHPTEIAKDGLAAIDQFVLKGGHALVFVDPVSDMMNLTAPDRENLPASNLGPLLKSWGVSYDQNQILADLANAQQVSTGGPTGTQMPYPLWLHLTTDDFDPHDPVTANLQTLNLATAGAIAPIKGASTSFVPLVRSSNDAALIDRSNAVAVKDIPQLMASIKPTHQFYTIAARITGPVKTAYPGGPGLQQSSHPISVLLMADSDIFDDRFWVHAQDENGATVSQPFADNSAFVLNALENLTGSQDLISLRTRATNDFPFVVVDRLQAAAQNKFEHTADELQKRLAAAEKHLLQLQQGAPTAARGEVNLSPEQRAEIKQFQNELLSTRAQLRAVQHDLRKDIENLGSVLAFINIALVPILLSGFALLLGLVRRKRRRMRPVRT